MLKRYIKPEALSIQTEELCTANFNQASVISGNDKNTLKDVIPVVEDRDMNNHPKRLFRCLGLRRVGRRLTFSSFWSYLLT